MMAHKTPKFVKRQTYRIRTGTYAKQNKLKEILPEHIIVKILETKDPKNKILEIPLPAGVKQFRRPWNSYQKPQRPEETGTHFSCAEWKELSTQNPVSSKNIFQE